MDIWVVSIFCLLWIMLLWTRLNTYIVKSLLSFVYKPRSKIMGLYNSMLKSLKNCHTIFHSGHSNVMFPATMHKGSSLSVSLSMLVFCFYDKPFYWVWSISLWSWFAFPSLFVTLSIFPVVIGHLYIFFGEMSTQILCPIIGCIYPIWFLLLNFKSSLYILGINPLSDIWFENIFSHCVGCLFTLWIVSVDAHCFNFDEVLMCLFFFFFLSLFFLLLPVLLVSYWRN